MAYLGNSPGVASQRVVTQFTATSGQTTFTPQSGYTIGYLDVFLNGVKLVNGDDYTASDGTSITLISAASLGDSVELVSFTPRGLSDGWLKAEADSRYLQLNTSFSGDVTGTYSATTLANSGATAGTYGSTSAIPQITVDAKGRITSVSSVDISSLGDTVISSSGTSAALRITQTGTGNALLVEDSANPDSTPFVVNNFGQVLFGNTTSISYQTMGLAYNSGKAQIVGADGNTSSQLIAQYSTGSTVAIPTIVFAKSKNATVGSHTIVASGDSLGAVSYDGSDGTNFIEAARVWAQVDGTPGTNDMPGRLIFSTTADGASSPTERMRIDSSGAVGIGAAPSGIESLVVSRNISGAVTSYGINNNGVVQSGVTTAAYYFVTSGQTAAASFTLGDLMHYRASQGTFGAGSTVTNQYGFIAAGNLIGATNNYGFYSNIAAGTGRWNFYAAGTAQNHFAGNVLIGSTSATPYAKLTVAADRASIAYNTIFSTSNGASFENDFYIGFNGTVTNVGNYQNFPIAFVTNNTERMRIDNAGRIGIGTSPTSETGVYINQTSTTVNAYGLINSQTAGSTTTNFLRGFQTSLNTTAASFTLAYLSHFVANQGTIGAGSTVSNQYGFIAESSLTGATNNYGFYSNIATGTGRWNFYAGGTANNYFAGSVGIGDVPVAGYKTLVYGAWTGSSSTTYHGVASQGTAQSDITSTVNAFRAAPNTAATAFTLTAMVGYAAEGGTVGAGSTVTNMIGFNAAANLTGGTNNYGFYSNIASGTNRWNFYANGTARNYLSGRLSLGDATDVGAGIFVNYNIGGSGGNGYGIKQHNTIQSSVTSTFAQNHSVLYTQAAAFTLPTYKHYAAEQGTIGAGSTVTSQFGYIAEANLTGATNNYGFFSNIASGTGRWNFYAGGTANNYFAGNVAIGTTAPAFKLDVIGNASIGNNQLGSNIYETLAIGERPGGDGYASLGFYPEAGNFVAKIDVVNSDNTFNIWANKNSTQGNRFTVALGVATEYVDLKPRTQSVLRAQSDGTTHRVGINTTSPGSTLDVKGTIRLSGSTSGYVDFAPAAAAGATTYTLPTSDGTAGQALSTNGSGTLYWATSARIVAFGYNLIFGT